MKKTLTKRLSIVGLILVLTISLVFSTPMSASAATQMDWMLSQLQADLHGGPGKSMRSFGPDSAFCYNNAYPYDQGTAIIAYTNRNYLAEARSLMDELKYTQNTDGSWYFCVDVGDPKNVIYDTRKLGAQAAWVIMGINYYTYVTNDTQYLDAATKAMDFVLTLQDSADGGIKGGTGITWKSVEHNLDAYSAFTHLSALLNKYGLYTNKISTYSTAATNIRSFLETYCWNDTQGRFIRGKSDNYTILDVNSWGVLALGTTSTDTTKNFTRGLDWQESNCKLTENGITGFDFNYDTNSDYDGNESFTAGGTHTGDGRDTVWSEGTLGIVLADYVAGRTSSRDYYLAQMASMAHTNGGIKYATTAGSSAEYAPDGNGDGKDDTESCITGTSTASTSWYLCAQNNLNPFDTFRVRLSGGIYIIDTGSSTSTPTPTPTSTPTSTPTPTSAATPTPAPNLVLNSSFESDKTSWSDWGNTTIVNNNAYSGSKSARIGTGEGGMGQIITGITSGATYTLYGYGKVSNTSETAYIGVDCMDNAGTKLAGGKFTITFNTTAYQYKSNTFNTVPGTTKIQVYIYKNPDGGKYAYLDDVGLRVGN